MNKQLKKYISESTLKNNPICLLQMLKMQCKEGYESIEIELQDIIDDTVNSSSILDAISDSGKTPRFFMKVEGPIEEFLQGLIDEVEICDSLDALSPANDATIDIYLDNRDRARDMGAES